MDTQYIVGLGEILWDVLPEGKKLGGAPANFAYHVAQQGLEALAVSAIASDSLGQEIRDELLVKGVKALLQETDHPTGTVGVSLDDRGVPTYTIHEGVAWDHLRWTEEVEAVARQTKAVCFGSLAQRHSVSRETILRFLDAVPKDGSLRIFDINLRQSFYNREVIEDSLKRANVLKLNEDEIVIVGELLGLTGLSERELCRHLMEVYSLDYLILTQGAVGSYVYTLAEESYQPTPRVEVADTVGAGDSFTATFVASLLQGYQLKEAHQRAVLVSAYVCSQHGPMPEVKGYLSSLD